MKRFSFSILIGFLVLPLFSWASFERNLSYGMTGNADVKKLQEFLQGQGFYTGPANGNFFGLTRAAVKKFQKREQIYPQNGVFGPKTRATVNGLLSSGSAAPTPAPSDIASLTVRIVELQRQLAALLAAQTQATTTPVVPSLPPAPEPATTTPATSTPVVSTPVVPEVVVSAASDQMTFPDTKMNPFLLGKMTIQNNTPQPVYFLQMRLRVSDEMNSTLNRAKKVFFILRDGASADNAVISRTEFQFSSRSPGIGDPNISELALSIPVSIEASRSRTFSLAMEDFEYVIGGKLAIAFSSLEATDNVPIRGTFSFSLTR